MKDRLFYIYKTITIKFSEAYKFGTNEPIQYEQVSSFVIV